MFLFLLSMVEKTRSIQCMLFKKLTLTFLVLLPILLLSQIQSGQSVPQLVFHDLNGKLVFINDFVGEPRMLNVNAERMTTTLIFFRSDDPRISSWLPEFATEARKQQLTCLFVSVDESPSIIQKLRKDLKLRAYFVIDKYGSAVEELGIVSLQRFSKAPTAIVIREDGTIDASFQDFRPSDVQSILEKASALKR